MVRTRRIKWILARWLDVIGYTAIASIVFILLSPAVSKWAAWVSEQLDSYSRIGLFAAALLFATCSGWLLKRLGALPLPHLRSAPSYPPASTAALVGAVVSYWLTPLVATRKLIPSASVIDLIIAEILLICGWAIAGITSWLVGRLNSASVLHTQGFSEEPPTQEARDDLAEQLTKQPQKLIMWLERNSAIESSADDFFGYSEVAERVAVRMTGPVKKTFAFAGAYGSGKTSLRRLVERYLKQQGISTCTVEGWGISASGAAEKVLGEIMRTISEFADASALVHLPERYTSALRGAPAGFFRSAAELCLARDPVEILRTLDRVVGAMGKRIVVFIEDLDRNADALVIAQVAALLDRLRALENVAFVIAIDASRAGAADLLRLCDYIEPIYQLPASKVAPLIEAFSKYCELLFPDDVLVGGTRDVVDFSDPWESFFHPDRGRAVSPVVRAIAGVLNTPRRLNHALRQTYFVWHRLHGEVEFQELLIAMAIRVATPQAWAFLIGSTDRLRRLEPSAAEQTFDSTRLAALIEKRRATLHEEFDQVNVDDEILRPLDELIARLFRGWQPDAPAGNVSPQSVTVSGPTDYWQRIVSEAVTGACDQDVLRLLKGWQVADHLSQLALRSFANRQWSDKLEQFHSFISGPLLEELFEQVIEKQIEKSGPSANMNDNPALLALWRIISHYKIAPLHRGQLITNALSKNVTKSLRLCVSLEYYWASTRTNHATPLRARRIRRSFEHIVRNKLTTPKAIVDALDPNQHDTLLHLIRYPKLERTDLGGDWSWIAPLLLDAAALSPESLLPKLAVLITTERTGRADRSALDDPDRLLDNDLVARLFASSGLLPRLARCLAVPIDTSALEAGVNAAITVARSASVTWGAVATSKN
jgi:hypothetical protein